MPLGARSIDSKASRNDRVPKYKEMTLGEAPLDPEMLSEVLECLEQMGIRDISSTPRLAGCIMSDAALVIRALADRAKVGVE